MADSKREGGEQPEPVVFSVKRRGSLWRIDRRDLLKNIAGGAGALAATGCTAPAASSSAFTPTRVERWDYTFQLVDMNQNGAVVPASGKNLVVVIVGLRSPETSRSVLHFRAFDRQGKLSLDASESQLPASAAPEIEQLRALLPRLRGAISGSADQAEFATAARRIVEPRANLDFAPTERKHLPVVNEPPPEVPPPPAAPAEENAAGRRLQGAGEPAESAREAPAAGRRLQNAGVVSPAEEESRPSLSTGRRMQEGARPLESGESSAAGRRLQNSGARKPSRELGTIWIDGTRYENARIVAVYSDGSCRIAHSEGAAVVQVKDLPPSARENLPEAVPKPLSSPPAILPGPRPPGRPPSPPRSPPSASPPRPTPAPLPTPRPYTPPFERPYTPPPPSTPYYRGHYWRPN
jgi:hypothetical protein